MTRFLLINLLIVVTLASCSKEEPFLVRETIVDSAFLSPNVGGPNQPNAVYVNLNTKETKSVQRNAWDLGFYCGNEFRININSSIYMAVKKLNFNNIDMVTTSDVSAMFNQVAIGTFNPANVNYVDDLDGNILKSAMDEVNPIDDENKVYLLNLGYNISTTTPPVGSVSVTGTHRGWKKIRVLKRGADYLLQYADLDQTTHKEVLIQKNVLYNFTFFSFDTQKTVSVEPPKNNWDMSFTVSVNEVPNAGTYGYTDFIVTNSKMNVKSYRVTETTEVTFDNFSLGMVNENLFSSSQRNIGSRWRSGGGPTTQPAVFPNIFFVIKDTEGIYYKVKFLALTNVNGERGFPQFRYKLL